MSLEPPGGGGRDTPPPPETLLDTGSRFVGQNLALLLSLGYLYLTAVGIAHQARYYRAFGIDILEFGDAGDFLLAGVRDPLIILMSLIPFPLAWVYFRLVNRVASAAAVRLRRPVQQPGGAWRHPLVRRSAVGLMLLTWILAFVGAHARQVARDVRGGKGRKVTIDMVAPAESLGTRDATLLGTTARYVFLYDVAAGRTEVVPVENVRRLSVSAPARRSR